MPTLQQTKSYLNYWLDAVDEHSLHAPFLFDFYTRVVKGKAGDTDVDNIEQLRTKLLADNTSVSVQDFGSGSAVNPGTARVVREIAATSLSPQKFSSLYSRIIADNGAKKIVELGTSLGINALYLARTPGTSVTTFEGSTAICEIANTTFEFAGATNIRIVKGNIDHTFGTFLQTSGKIDFAFIDANHRLEATKKYFDLLLPNLHPRSIVVLDDIHYSGEMEKAWKTLQQHPLVYVSVDLFRCGILFFDPSLNKQHVVLQF